MHTQGFMPKNNQKGASKKSKPHDAIFKVFFSDTVVAKNYLVHYTPSEFHSRIDFSFFRKSDTSYVSSRFGVAFSDVSYETQLIGGTYVRLLFLFEHKSYIPSHPIYLQLLDYLLQIWEDDTKNKRPLSLIVPIVVYHGESVWIQKPFWEYFPGERETWRIFIPHFHYLLTDLNKVPSQVIERKKNSEHLRNLFLALKFSSNKEQVKSNWKKIFTFGKESTYDDRDRILLQSLTLYIYNLFNMEQTDIKKLSEDLPEPEHSWIDDIPEIFGERWKKAGLRKGRKEGLKIGREEGLIIGRAEGKAEGHAEGYEAGYEGKTKAFVLKTLDKFPAWSDEEVAEFTDTTVDYIRELRSLK